MPAPPPQPDSPEPLLPRIAGGDETAVRQFLDRYGGLVWSLARRFSTSEADAEDAAQEIFLELWKHAERYDERVAGEATFVAMIARRRLIDRRRREGRSLKPVAMPEAGVGDPDDRGSPIELREEAAQAAEALERLSEEQQRVLRLSIFHGLSHERIARSTGLPLGTVKTHARRGLIRLRQILASPESDAAGARP